MLLGKVLMILFSYLGNNSLVNEVKVVLSAVCTMNQDAFVLRNQEFWYAIKDVRKH